MALKIAFCAMLAAAALLAFPQAVPAGEAGTIPVLAAQAKEPVPMAPGEECPSILFSKEVVEGTLNRHECYDYCWMELALPSGEIETFLVADYELEEGDLPPGAKVKVDVERRQEMMGYEGDEYYCRNLNVAIRAVAAK